MTEPVLEEPLTLSESSVPTNIESLCMNCGENGMSTLLLTTIPFYKSVLLISFQCEHCGFKNNEIQNTSEIAEKGIRYKLQVQSERDLNRTVVRSDHTSIRIPHLDFEIPSQTQKGDVTTVESILNRAVVGLSQDQEERWKQVPDVAAKIDEVIKGLEKLKTVEVPFELVMEDISGNCFLSNPNAPHQDSNASCSWFKRTVEQDHILGIYSQSELRQEEPSENQDMHDEVFHLPDKCPHCGEPCEVNMKMQDVPHFKEVVIMATNCEHCGYRSNEVKSGSGIEPKGVKITLNVSKQEDLSRDVLKSDTCRIVLPELAVEAGAMAVSGRFTTVEGVLDSIKSDMSSSPYLVSDSTDPVIKGRVDEFIKKVDKLMAGEVPFTLILEDPAGNSYIQNLSDTGVDERLKIEHFERSYDQNEELGLNDMKVENYEKENEASTSSNK